MFSPVGFLVLVKPEPVKEALKSSLIEIPDDVLRQQQIHLDKGTVISIGSKAWTDLADGEPWAKVGDKVQYARHGGKLVEDDDGTWYVLLQDRDILGVYND